MDLTTIERVRRPSRRSELTLGRGEAWLAGGTWLFSEPQPHLTGLVDLTALGWPALESLAGDGLRIAATCTLAELSRIDAATGGTAHPLFFQCCTALFGSFKVWSAATVGGNLANALPAGPMISLAVALDGEAVLWGANEERRMPVARLVTGIRSTRLEPGELIRAIEIDGDALASRTAYRKIALSPLGRSGAVVIGRLAPDGAFTLAVTAATARPELLRFAEPPEEAALAGAVDGIRTWFTDPHGAADWRRAVTRLLAEEIRRELA